MSKEKLNEELLLPGYKSIVPNEFKRSGDFICKIHSNTKHVWVNINGTESGKMCLKCVGEYQAPKSIRDRYSP